MSGERKHWRYLPARRVKTLEAEIERLTAEVDRLAAQDLACALEGHRLRAEIEWLRADPTIYKHQCGHCHRMSPLPFLIPGYLLGGPA